MLTALIGPIADLAGTWMSGKVEEKKGLLSWFSSESKEEKKEEEKKEE